MSASNVLGQGRTALVTGASHGIGTLIARQVASQGGHVVLTGRSAADLKAVTSELAAAGADVTFIPADLTQPGAAETLAETIERQRGGIDLLVNNAGGDPLREFHTMTIEENLRTLQLNLIAPVALFHAALDGMLRRGRGHIVNISAMAGRVSFPYTEVYAAAKDGLIGFTRVRPEPGGRGKHHHAEDHRAAGGENRCRGVTITVSRGELPPLIATSPAEPAPAAQLLLDARLSSQGGPRPVARPVGPGLIAGEEAACQINLIILLYRRIPRLAVGSGMTRPGKERREMNEACDRCGPAVRAAYRVERHGELYLCRHCASQQWAALCAQGWTIWPVGALAVAPQANEFSGAS